MSEETIEVVFKPDRVTKNTVRFEEELAGDLDSPKIGTLYVPKATLADVGYGVDDRLVVTLSVVASIAGGQVA